MNQPADSWKKNLQLIRKKSLIYLRGWLLSHTMRRSTAENRNTESGKPLERVTKRLFWRLGARSTRIQPMRASAPSAFRGNAGPGEQNESGIPADSTAGIMAGKCEATAKRLPSIRQDAGMRNETSAAAGRPAELASSFPDVQAHIWGVRRREPGNLAPIDCGFRVQPCRLRPE
jgi:hypothetical protein